MTAADSSATAIEVVGLHVWPDGFAVPQARAELVLDWGGPVGDRHHGETMDAGVRQRRAFDRGTRIRNHRQVSLVDTSELERIAAGLGLERIAPGVLADNICLTGVPALTSLARMTRLQFDSGATLMLGGENTPCTITGDLVERAYGVAAHAFPKAAIGLRGVTGWVECPGTVRLGERARLIAP